MDGRFGRAVVYLDLKRTVARFEDTIFEAFDTFKENCYFKKLVFEYYLVVYICFFRFSPTGIPPFTS